MSQITDEARGKIDNESILARQKEAEKAAAVSSPEAQKFMVYFEGIQREFNSALDALTQIQAQGGDVRRLANPLCNILRDMLESANSLAGRGARPRKAWDGGVE